MMIKDRKLYASYVNSENASLRSFSVVGTSLAASMEILLGEGKSFDEVLRDSYISTQIADILKTDSQQLIKFLRECWIHGDEFVAALWRLKDRREKDRQGPIIEIDLG